MLPQGPLSYFQAHCARCHGPYGSFYALPFKCDSAAALTAKIDEMARGPGGAPLDAEQLSAQTAFHRLIQRDELFLSVTSIEGGEIHGEVSPDAEVDLVYAKGRASAEVDGHRWYCRLEDPSQRWNVEARLESKRAVLDPQKRAFSEVK